MSAWAETSVKRREDGGRNQYPPLEGEPCADCGRDLRHGERVFRLTERKDEAWVCESCLAQPEPMGA